MEIHSTSFDEICFERNQQIQFPKISIFRASKIGWGYDMKKQVWEMLWLLKVRLWIDVARQVVMTLILISFVKYV